MRVFSFIFLFLLSSKILGRAKPYIKAKSPLVILSLEEAKKVLAKQCSRESPNGITEYWVPAENEIKRLESDFVKCVKGTMGLSNLIRQYAGFKRGQKSYIYGNYLPKDGVDPVNVAMITCDGGSDYFGFIYESNTRIFSEFRFNAGYSGGGSLPGFSDATSIQCK
jgi:hypothetical protein